MAIPLSCRAPHGPALMKPTTITTAMADAQAHQRDQDADLEAQAPGRSKYRRYDFSKCSGQPDLRAVRCRCRRDISTPRLECIRGHHVEER
jgi:hypothetical protein